MDVFWLLTNANGHRAQDRLQSDSAATCRRRTDTVTTCTPTTSNLRRLTRSLTIVINFRSGGVVFELRHIEYRQGVTECATGNPTLYVVSACEKYSGIFGNRISSGSWQRSSCLPFSRCSNACPIPTRRQGTLSLSYTKCSLDMLVQA